MSLKSVAELTEKETQTVTLVAKGLRDREIAEKLNTSVATVKKRLELVYGKLQITGVGRGRYAPVKITCYAIRTGLITP